VLLQNKKLKITCQLPAITVALRRIRLENSSVQIALYFYRKRMQSSVQVALFLSDLQISNCLPEHEPNEQWNLSLIIKAVNDPLKFSSFLLKIFHLTGNNRLSLSSNQIQPMLTYQIVNLPPNHRK